MIIAYFDSGRRTVQLQSPASNRSCFATAYAGCLRDSEPNLRPANGSISLAKMSARPCDSDCANPSAMSRRLTKQKSHTIGMIVPDGTNRLVPLVGCRAENAGVVEEELAISYAGARAAQVSSKTT